MASNGLLQTARLVMRHVCKAPGFDRVMDKVQAISCTPGQLICEMKVEEEHGNRGGSLHGGLTATLVDMVSTTLLLTGETPVAGVSVDMNITYMKAAHVGSEVLIDAKTLKMGKKLAFLQVDIINKLDRSLVAQGRHTKFIGQT